MTTSKCEEDNAAKTADNPTEEMSPMRDERDVPVQARGQGDQFADSEVPCFRGGVRGESSGWPGLSGASDTPVELSTVLAKHLSHLDRGEGECWATGAIAVNRAGPEPLWQRVHYCIRCHFGSSAIQLFGHCTFVGKQTCALLPVLLLILQ